VYAVVMAPDPYIHRVNTARTVMLYGVAVVVGILLGLATAQATNSCTGSCTSARPLFAIWESGLIGLGCAVVVLIACALLDEEFIPVTRQWLRAARRRVSGDGRKRQPS
jgi:ABC-type antimicrobial peptide transport system permease subunit